MAVSEAAASLEDKPIPPPPLHPPAKGAAEHQSHTALAFKGTSDEQVFTTSNSAPLL